MVRSDDGPFMGIYDFYSAPDGENCVEKTAYYAKYFGIFGFGFAASEIVLLYRPVLISSAIGRFGRFMLPFTGMGLLYGATVCISGQLRKKDDTVNHVLAGMAAGSVWGFKFNKMYPGVTAAIFFGLLGGYVKYFKHHNIKVLGYVHRDEIDSYHSLDLSIRQYEDPGRPLHNIGGN